MSARVHDFVVVGGGIVGLATALTLLQKRPGADVLVVDKATHLASQQTGHNSGVIHAGVYYAPGSKKALFCKQGAQWTRDFCDQHGIAYRNTGKMIVATSPLELERLDRLRERSLANELDIEMLDVDELREREPHVAGLGAMYVKASGIVDYREVCEHMAREITRLGGEVRLASPVLAIHESLSEVGIRLGSPSGDDEQVWADKLVVCGGIQADRLAAMAGLEPDFRMVPFRGEYYRLVPEKSRVVGTLIYPVPDPSLPFLGVHLTPMMDGSTTVGPNAVMGFSREGYRKGSVDARDLADIARFGGFWRLARGMVRTGLAEQVDSIHRPGYLKRVQKYCPSVELRDLLPHPPGIRAQAVRRDGTMVEDFHFLQTERMLHVCNAPSPAATSAMPIADHITTRLLDPHSID